MGSVSSDAAESPPSPKATVPRIILDNFEELVATLLLVIVAAVLALQVFMRSALAAPLAWPEELSRFLFAWASVLGAVGAAKRLGLVRVETLTEKLPPGVRAFLDYVILIATGVLLAVLGWQGWQMTLRSSFAATSLPITWAWMYSAAPVFAVLAYARMLQVQLFKYRFAFIENILRGQQPRVEAGGSL
jgi:TRAP-type C4-dicarboxylate transport system permease small subunit